MEYTGLLIKSVKMYLQRRKQTGGVLVEFALVALIGLVLAGAVFDYGRAFYAAQQLERASRVATREIALLPMPPVGLSLEQALECRRADTLSGVGPCATLLTAPALPRETVFDPDFLAIPCTVVTAAGFSCESDSSLDDFFSLLPVVNQLLRPLMVFDRTPDCATPDVRPCIIRYPGALVTNADPNSATGFSVVIPVVAPGGGFTCVNVVEPIGTDFSPDAGGLVSLRFNYPFQAVALLSWQNVDGQTLPVTATNPGGCAGLGGGLTPTSTLGALPVSTGTPNVGPYAGELGLGRQLAFGQVVRPFRRVVSSEASFRREVYL